jgi:hypothetical protein
MSVLIDEFHVDVVADRPSLPRFNVALLEEISRSIRQRLICVIRGILLRFSVHPRQPITCH